MRGLWRRRHASTQRHDGVGVGRKVRARTVLIPTLAEAEAALAARQHPDTIVAMHQRS